MRLASTPEVPGGGALRVVHVVRQFAPAVGGLEEAVLKLCLTLRSRGVEASVVTLDRIAKQPGITLAAHDTVQGIPVTRVPFRGSWRYPLAPQALGAIKPADVVHVHAIDFFFDFFAATRLLHGKPLIASTHGGFFHTSFARRLKQAYFQTVTRTSALAYKAICASSRSDFEMFQTVAGSRLSVVENGVDTVKWAGLASRAPERSLLAIGRFASHKQLDKLMPLLQALRALDPAWRLAIAGRPWDVSPDELRSAADAAGVLAAVDVLVEPSDDAIGRAIGQASYVVSASSHEGFGLGVVEGMAAGLVPVLNGIPPFRDLVERTGCGVLIEIDDPAAAADIIERGHVEAASSNAPTRSDAIAAAGQFGWPAAAALFFQHYLAAVQSPPLAVARLQPSGTDPC